MPSACLPVLAGGDSTARMGKATSKKSGNSVWTLEIRGLTGTKDKPLSRVCICWILPFHVCLQEMLPGHTQGRDNKQGTASQHLQPQNQIVFEIQALFYPLHVLKKPFTCKNPAAVDTLWTYRLQVWANLGNCKKNAASVQGSRLWERGIFRFETEEQLQDIRPDSEGNRRGECQSKRLQKAYGAASAQMWFFPSK